MTELANYTTADDALTAPQFTPQRVDFVERIGSLLPLTFFGVLLSIASALLLGLLLTDHRLLMNEPLWLKPLKFTTSTTLYCLTFVWLLNFIHGATRMKNLIAWGTAVAMLVEIVIIVGQAWRGERSHFNFTSSFNGALFLVMGGFIGFAWILNFVLLVLLCRQRFEDAAFGWSLRLGTLITLIGAALGFFMVSHVSQSQVAQLESANEWEYIGGHSFGGEDGGAGLPIVGWSTTHGDMRPAHFLGLHGIQLVPLLGLLVTRGPLSWLGSRQRVHLIWALSGGYGATMLILAWQALRGQSIVSPDSLTSAGLISVFGGVVAVIIASLVSAYRKQAPLHGLEAEGSR